MKRKFILVLLLLLAVQPAPAQWRNAYKGEQIVAFGVHDTSLFIGIKPDVSSDAIVWRLDELTPNVVWEIADTGLDRTKYTVSSFASLGLYLFASQGSNRLVVSSNNGSSWTLGNATGPVATNGTYLFGGLGTSLARSVDTDKTWIRCIPPNPIYLCTNGASIFTISDNSFWRSKDSGTTWSQLQPPDYGPMVLMGSLLFIQGMYEVAESTDSGTTWSVLYVDSEGLRLSINCLTTDGKNLFVGTPKGVYLSTDVGKSWQPENTGLAYQNISTMCVFDSLLFIDVSNMPGGVPYAAYDRPISEMVGNSAVKEGPIPGDTIALYPNPATGIVTVRSGRTPIVSIRVLNILGEERLALSNQYTSSLSFDLSTFASGTYFIEIQTENGTVQRKIVRE